MGMISVTGIVHLHVKERFSPFFLKKVTFYRPKKKSGIVSFSPAKSNIIGLKLFVLLRENGGILGF